MTIPDSTDSDDDARAVALELLRSGEATESGIARVAGVSRQVVHYWVKTEKIDVAKAQHRRLSKLWRAKLAAAKGKTKPKQSKADARAETDKLVAVYNRKVKARRERN